MLERVHTSRQEVESVGIDSQTRDGVEMGHHGVGQLARVVIVETNVSVLVGRDGQWQGRMRNGAVDLPAENGIFDPLVRVESRDHFARFQVEKEASG